MALSAGERRVLSGIEEKLTAVDPELARALAALRRPRPRLVCWLLGRQRPAD